MLGAIIGDIVGSVYEFANIKSTEFPLFGKWAAVTDDSIMTVAVAEALLKEEDYVTAFKYWGEQYPSPMGGYGSRFQQWLVHEGGEPYNSYGNGSAMRVAPCGYAFNTLEEVMAAAQRSAEVTHSHPEGIKGAQAVAAVIFWARSGVSKEEIRQFVESTFGYDLNRTVDAIRPNYTFDVSCQGTVPEAIIAFLEGESFEHTLRLAVSLGGDSDTLAAIAGSMAEPFWGIPTEIAEKGLRYIPADLREVVDLFRVRYAANCAPIIR